ncbi:hypothetical protein BYT27DRAFT_7156569 [Phlegmacium glaucopus]|nr:hypothetical protein BYT27DRAFT_7156569 [Phlegmacium glaucopus]
MKCAEFVQRISQYPATYLLPLMRCPKMTEFMLILCGQSEARGASQPFVHKHHFSMLATMALDEGIITAQVVEGSFTHDLFLKYLQEYDPGCTSHCFIQQLPIISPYPGP